MASLDDILSAMQNGVKAVSGLSKVIDGKFPDWVDAPATATSTGTPGQVAYDATHFYVCVATNTWVRTTLSTF